MSVSGYRWTRTGRSGEWDWRQKRTFTVPIEVSTTDQNDASVTIAVWLAANGLPFGTPYLVASGGVDVESDTGAILTKYQFTQRASAPLLWDVLLTFSSDLGENSSNQNPGNVSKDPLARPAIITYDARKMTKLSQEDMDTPPNPVINSHGDPISGGLQLDSSIGVISIEKNVANVSLATFAPLWDCVNSAPWGGFNTNQLRVESCGAKSVFENNSHFYSTHYTLLVAPGFQNGDDWNDWNKALDEGFVYDVGGLVIVDKHAMDAFGNLSSTPVLLDGNGRLGDPTNPKYLDFVRWAQADFSSIPTS